LTGKLYTFGQDDKFDADGTLTVDLTDETPRPQGKPGKVSERWVLDKGVLKKTRTKSALFTDERSDSYCVLFLPWNDYSQDITRVRLSVRFEPEDKTRKMLYAPEAILNIK